MVYMKQDGEISEFDGTDLLIFPLKLEELKLLQKSGEEFSKYINLNYDGEDVGSEFMQKVLNYQIMAYESDEENWTFHTMWMICSLSQRKIVGSIDFKDVADLDRRVEIGYGIGEKHWNNGYATQAVMLLERYAKSKGIKTLLASTTKSNLASQKVLDKNFFDKSGEDGLLFFYKKDIR